MKVQSLREKRPTENARLGALCRHGTELSYQGPSNLGRVAPPASYGRKDVLRGWRRECYCKQNSLLVVQSSPAYLGVRFTYTVQTTSPTGTAGARAFPGGAFASMSAFAAAIESKADMPICAANVR